MRERYALLERALKLLLPHRDVEAGFPQRVRERAKRVPVQRLGGHAAAMLLDVTCRRDTAELLTQAL